MPAEDEPEMTLPCASCGRGIKLPPCLALLVSYELPACTGKAHRISVMIQDVIMREMGHTRRAAMIGLEIRLRSMRSSGLPFELCPLASGEDFDMPKDAGGGGVTITGSNVDTAGGDIVGRDKSQHVSSHQMDDVFGPIGKVIENAGPSEKAAAEEKFRALKDEVAKGKHADDSVVAKLVGGLVGLVPGAVARIVSAFASPVLSGLAGPITKYVLDKIQSK